MIVDLEQYRKIKNSDLALKAPKKYEDNNSVTESIVLLDSNRNHPAILEAIKRANKRSW